jgi:Pyruvate/2-oxoacid:ferredoxin oxidoreductase delta subunit
MDFASFVEGPLLWIVFILLLVAVIARLGFFAYRIVTTSSEKNPRLTYNLSIFGRFLLPFHKGITKKPLYALLRYVFHICLFVVPIWFSGHIVLWSESRFEWDWTPLPEAWADWMTLLLLAFAAYFLLRRILFAKIRPESTASDYVLILLVALPFLSGYFLTHATLDEIAFFDDHIQTIHVLSGAAMIVMAAFLFARTRLNKNRCTGCASCELSCPTGTLESVDQGSLRIFKYAHYQCICCGACVSTCPENAAELRHEISLRAFLQIRPKEEIRAVELKACEKCGALFVPEPLFHKIGKTFTDDYLNLCPRCRKTNIGETYRRLSPWVKSSAGELGKEGPVIAPQ